MASRKLGATGVLEILPKPPKTEIVYTYVYGQFPLFELILFLKTSMRAFN